MSIIDANRKTSKCEKQFFQTLPEQVNALCAFLETMYKKDISILDAGSGKGRIVNGLNDNGFTNVKTNDLYFDSDYKGDFINYEFKNEFDLVISNPPYITRDKTKYLFIDKALKIAYNVFMLFPLQMLNYIYFCEKCLNTSNYVGRLTMYPKVILNPAGDYIQGGNTGYGWFWFNNNPFEDSLHTQKLEEFVDIREYR